MHGAVTGNVKASVSVELHPPARMTGNVETVALMVAKGVIFNGQCKMEPAARAGDGARPGEVTGPAGPGALGYWTLTWMERGLASDRLGRCTASTPCFDSA